MVIVKDYANGAFFEFAAGRFNNWCVYFNDVDGKRSAPKDTDYFTEIKEYADIYGRNKIYDHFVEIYTITGKDWSENVLTRITDIAKTYPAEHQYNIDKLFTTLYMGMVAEENWAGTKLGKRIKRLGIHALLYDSMSIFDAANFMRKKGWREIDVLCRERGF